MRLVHDHYQQPGGEDRVFAAESCLLEAGGHAVYRFALHNAAVGEFSRAALARRTFRNGITYRALKARGQYEGIDMAYEHNTRPLVPPPVYYAAQQAVVLLAVALLALLSGACRSQPVTPPSSASVGPPAAVQDARPTCPSGQVWDAGACRPAKAVYAPAGRVVWVDQRHPEASDANPGTRAAPWRTIGRATGAGVLRPGDAVLVRSGVYREFVRPQVGGSGPDARVTYAAYPGDTVVVSGAVVANDGWQPEGDAWVRPWTFGPMEMYGDTPVFRRELVVADGAVLRAVFEREALQPGTYWVEGPPGAPRRVWARFPEDRPPSDLRTIEVGTEPHLFAPLGEDRYADCGSDDMPGFFRIAGFTFRHAANHAQWGGLCAGSRGSLVEDVTVAWTNGSGVDPSGEGHVFRRVRALDNGQIGWSGSCTGCRFEDCEASRNNWKGYSPFWEAGGGKWTHTHGSTFRRFRAIGNEGPGLWLDIDNSGNLIEGTYAEANAVAGIMLEYGTVRTLVQHNVAVGTRWHRWSGAGILSQAASENVYVHNTLAGNEGHGLWLRLDPDRRARDGNNVVANNLLVGNGTAGHEAYEVHVRGETNAQARSTRFQANVYTPHESGATQTFFFMPTHTGRDYRGSDLGVWGRLTGSDAGAQLVGVPPDLRPVAATWRLLPARLGTDLARPLPDDLPLDDDGAHEQFRSYPHAGADPGVVAPGVVETHPDVLRR